MAKLAKVSLLIICLYFLLFMWAQVILMASIEYKLGYYWFSWTIGVYDKKANRWSYGAASTENPLVRLRVANTLYWCEKYETCTVTD